MIEDDRQQARRGPRSGRRGASAAVPRTRVRQARYRVLITLAALATLAVGLPAVDADETLLMVLRAELDRNMAVLREQNPGAYFISYTVHDSHTASLVASFGAIHRNEESQGRIASVQVRVGDYALDNTHAVSEGGGSVPSGLSRISLPLTTQEGPVRLELWRATDRAFKRAAQALIRVKTSVASTIKEEYPLPDFSQEMPEQYAGDPVALTLDRDAWAPRLRRVSAVFAEDPLTFDSDVSLSGEATDWYFVSSEGGQISTSTAGYRIFIRASTRAEDGMELPLYKSYFSKTPAGLPDEATLVSDARDMVDLLRQLRVAPLVEPFSGPAVLSGRAAGVFFHEIFGHRVEGHRQRDVDDGQTFAKRVDQQVLPAFLSVVFDPTRETLGDTELMGHYLYDDEGVKARPVTLVDQGTLKTFLLDRTPVAGFAQSNGHGRAAPGFLPVARQSNLLVSSTKTADDDQLIEQLKAEARRQGKPFGLLFDSIEGGFTTTGRGGPNAFNVLPNVVYRIYTDDRPPELVRGVDLIGTPLAAFGKILAAGRRVEVFNGMCGAESGNVPVSAASPALLVGEVEVQKKAQSQEALPVLPAPRPRGTT